MTGAKTQPTVQKSLKEDGGRKASPTLHESRKKKRAKQLWGCIRRYVKFTGGPSKADNLDISHGIHHMKTLNFDEPIYNVIFNSTEQCFLTVQHGLIKKFKLSDGDLVESFLIEDEIDELVYVTKTQSYLALVDQKIKMMNSKFEVTNTCVSPFDISCLYYNESNNNVVTGGQGNISIWCFRYGGSHMILHQPITSNIPESDDFERLVFDVPEANEQKLYAVTGTSIGVFDMRRGVLMNFQRNLHIKNITSVLFFKPLKYIITGSRDGCIKLWTNEFEIRIVFVGHVKPVISLSMYPQGTYIMSASYDRTIRVWSLETCDEVDLIECGDTLVGMETSEQGGVFYSHSPYSIDLWQVTHLHQMFASVGSPVQKMSYVTFGKETERVLCVCEDGCCHVLSPVDGAILTSMVPDFVAPEGTTRRRSIASTRPTTAVSSAASSNKGKEIVDAVYCVPLETMWACYDDGRVLRARTTSSPARLDASWSFGAERRPTCMAVYVYVVGDGQELMDTWRQVREPGHRRLEDITRTTKFGYTVMLLAGTADGCLATIDVVTGEMTYTVRAHGSHPVVAILVNERTNQLLTSGADKVVKVWMMYPNSVEPVSLVRTFHCAHTAVHMHLGLGVVNIGFQQQNTATYTSVHYNINNEERHDHGPDADHTDELTAIRYTPRLQLFATASRDGTVRLWDDKNNLQRRLKLNGVPSCMEFCNTRGDMLVAMDDKIQVLRAPGYLPQHYVRRLVCMEFAPQKRESEFPRDEALLAAMSSSQRAKIAQAASSYTDAEYVYEESAEDRERKEAERKERSEGWARIRRREEDMERMLAGSNKSEKARRKRKLKIRSSAFDKYMGLFYSRPEKIEGITGEDTFDPNPQPPPKPQPPRGKHEDRDGGFFPSMKDAKKIEQLPQEAVELHPSQSGPDLSNRRGFYIHPQSYIPNSILVRLLWPERQEVKVQETMTRDEVQHHATILPPVTTDQVNAISHRFTKRKLNYIGQLTTPLDESGTIIQHDIEDPNGILDIEINKEQPESLFEERERKRREAKARKAAAKRKALEERRKKRKAEGRTSDEVEEDSHERVIVLDDDDEDDDDDDLDKRQAFKPSAGGGDLEEGESPKMSGLKAKMMRALKTPTPPPSPPREPTPPPIPKRRVQTKPNKPIVKLISRPKTPQPSQAPPTPPPPTPPPPRPSFMDQFEGEDWFEKYKDRIISCMKTPFKVKRFFKVLIELLVTCVDWYHRASICAAMLALWGQHDLVKSYTLVQTIAAILEAQAPPDPARIEERQFLQACMRLYHAVAGKLHINDFVVELLTQYLEGEPMHQNFVKKIMLDDCGLEDPNGMLWKEMEKWEVWNLDEKKAVKPQLRSMVVVWLNEWKGRFESHFKRTVDELKKGRKLEGRMRNSSAEPGKTLHVSVNQLEGSKNVKVIEVLNYFCEMAYEQEQEREQLAKMRARKAKNTVLVLPPLLNDRRIKRLGEMHTAKRFPRERKNLAVEYRVSGASDYPDLEAPFSNKIKLSCAHVSMNPLDAPLIDQYDEVCGGMYQPVLITLRSPIHQKYFVPERSYVHVKTSS